MVSKLSHVCHCDELAIFLLGMCALLNLYSTQPILVQLATQLNVSTGTATLTISATTLGVAATAPLAGSISDHLGRKNVMLTAVAAILLATILCMAARSFTILLVGRFLQGMATPFVFAVAVAYIDETYAPRQASTHNSIYVAGTAFGGFSGRFLAGSAFDLRNDWHASFVPLIVILALAFVTTLVVLPKDTNFTPTASPLTGIADMGVYLRDWRVLVTCLVGAGLLFQQVASFTFGSLALQAPPFRLTSLQISLIFIVFLAPSVLTPFVGKALVRFGRVSVLLMTILLGLSGLILTLIPDVRPFIFGLTLSCISVFAGQSCALGFIGHYAHRGKSAAVGLYLTTYYLGGTLGSVIPSHAYALWGWWSTVTIIGITMLCSLVAASRAWSE